MCHVCNMYISISVVTLLVRITQYSVLSSNSVCCMLMFYVVTSTCQAYSNVCLNFKRRDWSEPYTFTYIKINIICINIIYIVFIIYDIHIGFLYKY